MHNVAHCRPEKMFTRHFFPTPIQSRQPGSHELTCKAEILTHLPANPENFKHSTTTQYRILPWFCRTEGCELRPPKYLGHSRITYVTSENSPGGAFLCTCVCVRACVYAVGGIFMVLCGAVLRQRYYWRKLSECRSVKRERTRACKKDKSARSRASVAKRER